MIKYHPNTLAARKISALASHSSLFWDHCNKPFHSLPLKVTHTHLCYVLYSQLEDLPGGKVPKLWSPRGDGHVSLWNEQAMRHNAKVSTIYSLRHILTLEPSTWRLDIVASAAPAWIHQCGCYSLYLSVHLESTAQALTMTWKWYEAKHISDFEIVTERTPS